MQLLVICDPGQDLDDELMLLSMSALIAFGLVKCLGVITTLGPAAARATLARGMLDVLGLQDAVPVAVGTDGNASGSVGILQTAPYLSSPVDESGDALMKNVLNAADDASITVLVTASHTDLMLLIQADEDLFCQKVKRVVSMGGVEVDDTADQTQQRLRPDTAHNNMFDLSASQFIFERCQARGVPLTIVSRFVAYACQLPKMLYDNLAATGSAVGLHLQQSQRKAIEQLWVPSGSNTLKHSAPTLSTASAPSSHRDVHSLYIYVHTCACACVCVCVCVCVWHRWMRACAPEGSATRAGLPARCDKQWFSNTFCAGHAAGRPSTESVWDLVLGFNMYDPVALFAAVPALHHAFDFEEVAAHGSRTVPAALPTGPVHRSSHSVAWSLRVRILAGFGPARDAASRRRAFCGEARREPKDRTATRADVPRRHRSGAAREATTLAATPTDRGGRCSAKHARDAVCTTASRGWDDRVTTEPTIPYHCR